MIDTSYNPDAAPEEVDESQLMELTDHGKLRESILSSVKDGFSKKFPMEDGNISLSVDNLRYNEARRPTGIAAAKKALMGGGTLGVPLHGDVTLRDKATGEILDQKKGHLLANVPYLTDRGTFVMRGTEYLTANQSLLRPGLFSRIKENGEIEIHGNTRSGTGPSFRMYMEPDTGIYRMSLGTSKIKLYPILRALGKTDADLEGAWGKEVLDLNRKAADKHAFGKFYDKLIGDRGPAMMARLVNQDPLPHLEDDSDPDEIPTQKEAATHRSLEEAEKGTDLDTTEAQRKSGRYRHGRFWWKGLEIVIENPRGSIRSGVTKTGKPWSTKLRQSYGYIRRVSGAHPKKASRSAQKGPDDDSIDVFVGSDLDSEIVFIIDQIDPSTGDWDEYKTVIGATNKEQARKIYEGNYQPGWKGLKSITAMSLPQFKDWLVNGDTSSPSLGQTVKVAMDLSPGLSGVGGPSAPKGPAATPAAVRPNPTAASLLQDLRNRRKAGVPSLKTAAQDDIPDEQKIELVKRKLSGMEVDPEVTYRTLGKAHSNIDPDTLMDASSKLLSVARGEAEPDDRDALSNKWFRTPDDMFHDRVVKDAGRVAQALFWRSKYDRSLKRLKPGHFTPQLHGLVIGNSLSQAVSGINPMELLDLRLKVVQTGEGGIGSSDMVPDSAREVHPTQLGFIDYIKTPESTSVGIDQRFAYSVRKGPGNQIYTKVLGRDGKPVWRTPSQLYGKRLAFPESSTQPVTYS